MNIVATWTTTVSVLTFILEKTEQKRITELVKSMITIWWKQRTMYTKELRYQLINVNCTTLFYKFVSATGVLFLFMSGKSQIIHLFLLKTFCAQASCQNNATCQSGFTRKRYRCLCASGFTGHDCEKGNTCVIEMNF